MLDVVAAAVLGPHGLLVVSKRVAPDVFFLPGGKPEAAEAPAQTLAREVREELGVGVARAEPLFDVLATAVHEDVPMRLAVLRATLDGTPATAAEIARTTWWPREPVALASAIRDVVVPRLRAAHGLEGPDGTRVERTDFATSRALRASVLRAGQDPDLAFPAGHDHPDTAYWAVLGPAGAVLSTVNAQPAAPPWAPDQPGWWQLRGMATAPEGRGAGHAAALVWAVIDHAQRRGARVWLNGRRAAVGLYARAGFEPVGPEWEHPERGPHTTMRR